jgi:hypothetical protein
MRKSSTRVRVFLLLLGILIMSAGFGSVEGQTPARKPPKAAPRNDDEIIHDIQELEQSLREAFVDGKSAWWDRHLDEHYAGLNPDGVPVRKTGLIQLYGSRDLQYEEMDLSDMSARIYDTCVIASTRSAVRGAYKGHDFSGTYYFVHVWVKEDSEWKLANSQATKLPE